MNNLILIRRFDNHMFNEKNHVMLEIINITKKYKKDTDTYIALDEVSFTVDKNDFIVVTGHSGSGKSTLLHTIGGLIFPDSGQISFNGKNIHLFSSQELERYRRRNVGFVFQQFHLLPYLTVRENIEMVCPKPVNRNEIKRYMEKCSIISLENKYPSELSVGEKQRTAFIRAIITSPDILLADEPTGNLDPVNSEVIMSLIGEFHKSGKAVILVSHSPGTAGNYSTKSIRLHEGRIA